MDGPVFDAMLKTALEEALRQDLEEAPPAPRPSRRHRRRMRLLLDGYDNRETGCGWRRRPAQWLAVVVIAALLTGTAAGYALGGGGLFQRMFEESDWAARYGGAADTDQLLGMGGDLNAAAAERNGLRFELLDAVSDGQFAMVCGRLTIQDRHFLEQMESPGDLSFKEWGMLRQGETELPVSCGLSINSWVNRPELEEGQYYLVFSVSDGALSEGGEYEVCLRDAFCRGGSAELAGDWTMSVTFSPAALLTGTPEQVCRIAGRTLILERLSISPLALNMELHAAEPGLELEDISSLAVRMEDGTLIGREDCVLGVTQSESDLRLILEFQMPLDVERVDCVLMGGQPLYLEE